MPPVSARRRPRSFSVAALVIVVLLPLSGLAWGPEGHRTINQRALENLPADVPAFLRSARAAQMVGYLGPEPDRWRSLTENELNDAQAPEHFLNLETADSLGALPYRRLDFEAALFAHGLRPETVGLQPWQTVEVWQRLKVALREYRRLSALTHPDPEQTADLQSVQQVALLYAGWLGHYVGDGAQPLHTTVNHDGWEHPPNPHSFSAAHGIHWRFEGTFVAANLAALDVQPRMIPLNPVVLHTPGDIFDSYVAYLRHSATLVDQVYTLDAARAFTGTGTPASRAFTADRLAAGASELRDLIYAAWVASAQPAKERF